MLTANFDPKFGEYIVHHGHTQHHTYSKWEAIEISSRTNGWIQYLFNDEVYSTRSWSLDIPETLESLYIRRAEQIRQKHDRVVLAYSGGFDSENMLQAFLKADLKVDAVLVFYHGIDDNKPSFINTELFVQTWPKIKRLQQTHPHIDVLRIDLSSACMDVVRDHEPDYQYLAHGFAPNNLVHSYLYRMLPADYQNRDSVIVFGVDKPRVRYRNGEFIANFLDCSFRSRPFSLHSGIEYFYWSPDLPELVIKQSQTIKKYWLQHFDQLTAHPGNRCDADLGWVLDRDHPGANTAIYPWCANQLCLTWRADPADTIHGDLFGDRDRVIYTSNTAIKYRIDQIYQSTVSKIPSNWFNQQDPRRGLIGILSRDYVL